jgi:DNA-binding MarR family transcriptional regulator
MKVKTSNINEPQGCDHIDHARTQWAKECPDIDTRPMEILARARRLLDLIGPGIEEGFARFGLERGEFDVIETLRRAGPPFRLTPTDLYTSLMLSSGGLTYRLDRLEEAGLVVRKRSMCDRRSVFVILTEAGKTRAEDAFRSSMEREAAILLSLDPQARDLLSNLLRKLSRSVEDDCQSGRDG